jgi:hypothetical protein
VIRKASGTKAPLTVLSLGVNGAFRARVVQLSGWWAAVRRLQRTLEIALTLPSEQHRLTTFETQWIP